MPGPAARLPSQHTCIDDDDGWCRVSSHHRTGTIGEGDGTGTERVRRRSMGETHGETGPLEDGREAMDITSTPTTCDSNAVFGVCIALALSM